jgi:hypothetical protein
MPEVIRITSESIQAAIRRLLPSQVGFGDDMQATNLITPIIDLTPSSEGSSLPVTMQQAIGFGNTAVSSTNSTDTLINTAGFYRIVGTIIIMVPASQNKDVKITITDGATTKNLFRARVVATNGVASSTVPIDFITFVALGETVAVTTDSNTTCNVSIRQVATPTGTLVNPTGFTDE